VEKSIKDSMDIQANEMSEIIVVAIANWQTLKKKSQM